MTSPNCTDCKRHRIVKAWQKLDYDNDRWNEFDRSICLHPNNTLAGKYRTDKYGGVRIGLICWVCRGTWR